MERDLEIDLYGLVDELFQCMEWCLGKTRPPGGTPLGSRRGVLLPCKSREKRLLKGGGCCNPYLPVATVRTSFACFVRGGATIGGRT
jgi:hypothetical protein